jgi:hypothetical protein
MGPVAGTPLLPGVAVEDMGVPVRAVVGDPVLTTTIGRVLMRCVAVVVVRRFNLVLLPIVAVLVVVVPALSILVVLVVGQ